MTPPSHVPHTHLGTNATSDSPAHAVSPLLEVRDMAVQFSMYSRHMQRFGVAAAHPDAWVLKALSFDVYPGEILCIVGSSGVGKSVAAAAVLGLLPKNAQIRGEIYYRGKPLVGQYAKRLRGKTLAYVPQSIEALDPMMKVGAQIRGIYGDTTRLAELFKRYRLDPIVANYYPHELSGGMARRALICGALINSPELIIADEPTPGLDDDLTTHVAQDFRMAANSGAAVVIITHNITLARAVADRVLVFKDGTIDPTLSLEDLEREGTLKISSHRDFRTSSAGESAPNTAAATRTANSCTSLSLERAERCLELRNISFSYGLSSAIEGAKNEVLSNVSVKVGAGERVGLLGPSGIGKSTLGKIAAGFLQPSSGSVRCDGESLPRTGRQPVQMIFQQPELAVNPRLRLGKILAEAEAGTPTMRQAFGIKDEWLNRYPAEVSGGELQRICIARALGEETRYIICDEITAMLDAPSGASLWQHLVAEAEQRGIGMLIISHDLKLLRQLTSRIVKLS